MVSYRVRVRKRTYLCGGDQIVEALKSSLYLCFRLDESGEPVRIGFRKTDGQDKELGLLLPGQTYIRKLDDVLGVYAEIATPADTFVDCTILGSED